MKSKTQFIETLEPRIAPAILVNGANLLGGSGNPSTGETSTGANTVTLVKVISGQALVFYNNGNITGISVGQHTKLDITGDVQGDIVTNLDANGRLTDSDHNPINGEDGGILNPYGIKGITTHALGNEKGSIGRIIAGGQVNNVNVTGELAGIYAGNGIFRNSATATVSTSGIDTNSVLPGVQDSFTFHQADSVPNGNAAIKNVTVNTARQLEIFAGSGLGSSTGAGAYGSAITNVTIAKTLSAEGSQPVVFLHAGDGGAGVNGGGAGGAITSFNDQGSTSYVKLQTGNGGSAAGGTGGVGGSLTASTIVSSSTRYDFVMGNGGDGQTGGLGGGIKTLSFTNNITGGGSLIATADLNGDGLSDVILVNNLTGVATVSLGVAKAPHAGEAKFNVALQSVPQADGTTLSTPFLPAEGANPTSLVVGDFNGDGLPDFAVSYASTDSVGVFLNHNNGAFAASRLDLGGISPTRIVAGDFTAGNHTTYTDLAIVSANATTTQGGLSSEVFVAANNGAGHFTLNSTAAAVIAGTATDAASTQVYNTTATATTLVGADLFIGLKNGTIDPVSFRSGAATIGTTINAFTGQNVAPVDSVDVIGSGGSEQVLAFSKDIHIAAENAGDTTASPQAQVEVFTLTGAGQVSSQQTFNPDSTTTKASFIAGTNLVGTVAPGNLIVWGIVERNYVELATLASDGALTDFAVAQIGGTYQFAASGTASNRFFFTTGVPGSTDGVAAFLPSEVPFEPRSITFASGNGGNGDQFGGGNAGAIKALTYTQTLGAGVLEAGGSYNTILSTGHGGNSNGGVGGNGGAINKATLSLNPAYLTYSDDTTTASFNTGAGGQGTTGGNGGAIQKTSTKSVFSQVTPDGGLDLDSVAVNMQTGDGGVGKVGAGGAGGSIVLAGQAAFSGVTFVDADSLSANVAGLVVKAGNGGNGVTSGGTGGSLTSVGSQNTITGGKAYDTNELASALLTSGSGGTASAGYGGPAGGITEANVVTQQATLVVVIDGTRYFEGVKDGSATVVSGDGGTGHGGGGGKAGTINGSTIGSVGGDPGLGYAVLVKGGVGGDGDTGGGAGGSLKKLSINGPADSTLYAAVAVAGKGGDALSNGVGGKGGGIGGITQTKDVNSAINVIQAGDGGTGAGNVGGAGGSVKNINTVGFIGLPSTNSESLGAFNQTPVSSAVSSLFASSALRITGAGATTAGGIPQGIFAGEGMDGGVNGSVLNVVARQIAAIGATVQANGHFDVATSVDNITADLIGYYEAPVGVDGTGKPFRSVNGAGTSPSSAVPVDGFILAGTVSGINTVNNDRTNAYTFLS